MVMVFNVTFNNISVISWRFLIRAVSGLIYEGGLLYNCIIKYKGYIVITFKMNESSNK